MGIRPWTKIGPISTLAESNGRRLNVQKFINPTNGIAEEFSFLLADVNSVIIFPITQDRKVVAIRQFRHAADDVFIELPGGRLESDELSVIAARRELLEETGFYSEKVIELKSKKIWVDPGSYRNFYIPCLATDCRQVSEPKLDAMEFIETVTIPIGEWLDMILDGLITDAKTLAITFLALSHIGISLK